MAWRGKSRIVSFVTKIKWLFAIHLHTHRIWLHLKYPKLVCSCFAQMSTLLLRIQRLGSFDGEIFRQQQNCLINPSSRNSVRMSKQKLNIDSGLVRKSQLVSFVAKIKWLFFLNLHIHQKMETFHVFCALLGKPFQNKRMKFI